MRNAAWLFGVLLLAAAPRAAWYRGHQPELPPDTYGYLDVAREWRGHRAPDGTWDDRSQLPSNNLAARTPGYPLFLDLVFAATGFARTPSASLANVRPVLPTDVGASARANHLRHFETDENVRAVQAAQHTLGATASALVFDTVSAWGATPTVAVLASLAAIAWNPVWIMTLETTILGETVAGVLLIAATWLASTRRQFGADVAVAVLGALAVLVRPAMAFAAVPTIAYVTYRQRAHAFGAPVVLAAAVVVALLVVNNGVRYGYWGVSSLGGTTFLSHANDHAADLRPPVRDAARRFHPYLAGGSALQYAMATEGGRPFLEVSRDLDRAAIGYVIDHPLWYLRSVAEAVVDFFSPPFRYIGGDHNVLRQHFPAAWAAISVCAMALLVVGVVAVATNVPVTAKLGPAAFLVSAVGTSLLAHTENRRFAAPLVPLVLASGMFLLQRFTRSLMR